ncbi:MAG: hypothetical protein KDB21_15880 [Acidimicrobiales bacterium]|nr:hypothetical protein [Acidimicrobiales bacterium]
MTDAASTAAAIDGKINAIGGSIMFHPATLAVGAEHGLDDLFGFYFGGRAAVLGDVEADVVRSAFAWWHPATVEHMWSTSRSNHSAAELRDIYGLALAAGARAAFAEVEGVDRFVELGRKVIDAVEPLGTALFAGWRNVAVPDDAPGAAGLVVQTLRELRGDLHIHGIAAVGLTPLQALMARDGEGRAKMFGWPEPYPDGTPWKDQHVRAEEITSALMTACYEVLSDDERTDLVEIVPRLQAAVAG